jgi:hypothetical protein
VGNVALGQVSLRVPRFSPVNIIPPWLYIHKNANKNQIIDLKLFHQTETFPSDMASRKRTVIGRVKVKK